jgi:hypothetical protein
VRPSNQTISVRVRRPPQSWSPPVRGRCLVCPAVSHSRCVWQARGGSPPHQTRPAAGGSCRFWGRDGPTVAGFVTTLLRRVPTQSRELKSSVSVLRVGHRRVKELGGFAWLTPTAFVLTRRIRFDSGALRSVRDRWRGSGSGVGHRVTLSVGVSYARGGSPLTRLDPPLAGLVVSGDTQSAARRWISVARAWSRGRMTISSMLTCGGWAAAQRMHSATSGPWRGSVPR